MTLTTLKVKKVGGSDRIMSPKEQQQRMVMKEKEQQLAAAQAAEKAKAKNYVDEGAIMMQSDPEDDEEEQDKTVEEEDKSMLSEAEDEDDEYSLSDYDEEAEDSSDEEDDEPETLTKPRKAEPQIPTLDVACRATGKKKVVQVKKKPVLLSKKALSLPKPSSKPVPVAPTSAELKQRQTRINEQKVMKVCHSKEYNEDVLLKSFREHQDNQGKGMNDIIPTGRVSPGGSKKPAFSGRTTNNKGMFLEQNDDEDSIMGAEILLVIAGVVMIAAVVAYLFFGRQS